VSAPATMLAEPQLVGDREILATRIFDAPRDLVWKVWTEREHIEKWWGPNGFTTTTSRMDVKPGGMWRYVMHGPDGRDYENRIVYVEVVKPERLSYSHDDADDSGDKGAESIHFQVNVNFEELGGKTKIIMRMVFPSAKLRDFVIETHGAVEGLKQTLGRLGEYLGQQR
jgi:uncharacterized protein YndB with AHSA1/START domain